MEKLAEASFQKALQMAPGDPHVLLALATRSAKEKPWAERQLQKAIDAGAERMFPLSVKILAWEINPSRANEEALKSYLQKSRNERVTQTALRGRADLAKLIGMNVQGE